MAGQYLFGAKPTAPAPANPYASQFGIAGVGAGNTSYTRGGGAGGHPLTTGTAAAYNNPQTLKEYYALDPNQRRAYGDPTGLMQAGWQASHDSGYGPGLGTAQGYVMPGSTGSPGAITVGAGAGGAGGASGQSLATVARGGSSTAQGAVNTAGNLATGRTPVLNTSGTGELPPMNAGESSSAYMARIGMSPQQIQAALTMSQQNPGMSFQDIMSRLGTGAGSAAKGDYPPINAGEDSTAYMQRIGMSPADISAALAMAKANPGMSFQDIMSQLHSGGGAGGSTGNIHDPGVTLNNLTSTQGTVNGVPGYTGGGSFNLADWQDPGYDFRLKQGLEAVQGSAAAQGNLLSGPTLKALTNYGQDAASQEYEKAYGRFTGNRAFNYGVDTGDRAFDYLTRTGDRDFNYGVIKDLADQGRYGTTGESDTNRLLATLLSGNILSGGQANAAATVGGGNIATDAISRFLQTQAGQAMLDKILAARGTPAPTGG